MPALVRGRIVYSKIPIPDPQGQNPKEGRPFVVISKDNDIKDATATQAVGITGELLESPADHYVLLPFGPNAKSGLKQKSAALCTWLVDIQTGSLDVGKGFIRPDLVEEIVRNVLRLKAIPLVIAPKPGDEAT